MFETSTSKALISCSDFGISLKLFSTVFKLYTKKFLNQNSVIAMLVKHLSAGDELDKLKVDIRKLNTER